MKARKKGESEWKDYKEVFDQDGMLLGLETAGYTQSVEDLAQELGIADKDSRLKDMLQPEYVSNVLPLECFDLWPAEDVFIAEAAKLAMVKLIGKTSSNGHEWSHESVADEAIAYARALLRRLQIENKRK